MQITKRYIYPPRPMKDAVPFASVDMYQRLRYWLQLKFNDKRSVFSFENDEVEFFNRHKGQHKTYTLSDDQKAELVKAAQIIGVNTSTWNYLDGGLIDGKNKNISDTFVIWDILVCNGNWLVGSTYKERYRLLTHKLDAEPWVIMIGGQEFDLGIKVTENVFIPRNWTDKDEIWNFVQAVNEAAGWHEGDSAEPLLEGMAIKNPEGKLEIAVKEKNNTSWFSRCRVRTKRHRF